MDTFPPANSEHMNVCENHECQTTENSEPVNICEDHECQTTENRNAGIFQCLIREQHQFTKPPQSPGLLSENAQDHDHCKFSDLVDDIKGSYSYMANNNFGVSQLSSRKKRAAVLICIFEGLEGELRVILTKRSMNLSTHPGKMFKLVN